MLTILPEIELKQAWKFFTMNGDSLGSDEYYNALKNVGIVFNKNELKEREEKTTYTEADFMKDYQDKMKTLTKEELAKVFLEFDPEATGIIAYDVLHRALSTYGERLSKEETDRFMQICKLKPGDQIKYNDLLDEIVKI